MMKDESQGDDKKPADIWKLKIHSIKIQFYTLSRADSSVWDITKSNYKYNCLNTVRKLRSDQSWTAENSTKPDMKKKTCRLSEISSKNKKRLKSFLCFCFLCLDFGSNYSSTVLILHHIINTLFLLHQYWIKTPTLPHKCCINN